MAESHKMGALLTGVERMTLLIGRCQIYETLYLKGEPFEKEEWKQVVTSLTSALVTLYATMLSFLANAIRVYNQGSVSRTLCAILNPTEVIGFLNRCQTLESNVALEAENCERIHNRRAQANSEDGIHKLKQILDGLETPIWQIDSRVAALGEKLDRSERLGILEWISDTPYEENHDFASKGRTYGTGEWLLQHERYGEWRECSASATLWLHGDRECHCVIVLRKFSNKIR